MDTPERPTGSDDAAGAPSLPTPESTPPTPESAETVPAATPTPETPPTLAAPTLAPPYVADVLAPPAEGPVPPAVPGPGSGSASSSGRTVAIVIGIVAAAVLVLGGLGVAIVLVAQNAVSTLSESGLPVFTPPVDESASSDLYPEKEPLLTGEPGPTVAAEPTVCPQQCFTVDDFDLTVLSDDVVATLGTPDLPPEWDDFRNSTAQKEFLYSASSWESGEGSPAECFPITVYSPIAAPLDGRAESADDPVGFTQGRLSVDQYSSLYESPRLFTDSASAEAHLATFASLVAGCSSYEIGDGASYWTADVTPMPALELPSSVAAVGWVEDSPFGRFYGADLQRGNLVLRITLYTDGAITEGAWREYVVTSAENLASLTP